jgi:protein TIF31
VRGLYTLATAIVDYRGHRIVAQSIIPGILQREQTSNVVYGSIDNGKTIASEEKFHELMVQAGKALHFKENTVKDGEGKEFKICCPVESKVV